MSVSDTTQFLKMYLNLKSKQGLSLDLNLQWDTVLFPICLAEKIIIICLFYNLFFECLILP